MRTRTARALLALAATVLATGCLVGQRMQPPRDLAGVSERLEVTGRSGQFGRGLFRSEDFDLGPYRVSEVDRDWNKVQSHERDLWYLHGRKVEGTVVGGFSFSLHAGEAALRATCGTGSTNETYTFGSWSFAKNTESLGCKCRSGSRVVASLFVVSAKAGKQWDGWLELGGNSYQVTGQRQLEGGKTIPWPAGYRFDAPSPPPLGAVDITEPGRAWLHESIPAGDRAAAACAAAAILLEPKPPSA